MKYDLNVILEYVNKGIEADIQKCYSVARKGQKILAERKSGKCEDKSPKTNEEINIIISKNNKKAEELYKFKEELYWYNELGELEIIKDLVEK